MFGSTPANDEQLIGVGIMFGTTLDLRHKPRLLDERLEAKEYGIIDLIHGQTDATESADLAATVIKAA
ncbi:MAG: hypothetical protein JOZ65_00610 [Chloroflexi bacterium]|nr:hypothetical protein [Chloroflexota bacterium]